VYKTKNRLTTKENEVKKLLQRSVLAAALLAAAFTAFAQTAVVQSLNNVYNRAATYKAAANVTLASTPTIAFALVGSATKTVYVKDISVSCVKTSLGSSNVTVIRSNTALTGGTSTAPTAVPVDSTNSSATATVAAYTANPGGYTPLSLVMEYVPFVAPAEANNKGLTRIYSAGMDQHIVLRGVSQSVAVNFAGATLTGGVCSFSVTWMEQ
jgi:hypothetical protein